MSNRVLSARGALVGGVLLGLLGDALLRVDGAPGLNILLCALALAATTIMLQRRVGGVMSGEAYMWIGVGVLCAAALAWRDAPPLKLLALGCALLSFSLPALRAGAAWVRRGSAAGYVAAFAAAAAHAVFGAPLALADARPADLLRASPDTGGWRRISAVSRGVAIGLPLVIVFGGLFSAADAVFAGMVAEVVTVDFEWIFGHVALVGVLGWLAAGYLSGFTSGRTRNVAATGRAPVLGITETAIAIGLLNLLFLAFVIVQFRYLFGGSTLVEVTPGLTYSEYARRGFFELVMAVMLALPVLLAADALLIRRRAADDAVFRGIAGMQILLVLGIAFSALERLRLYRAAYGLTEQRVYATAALLLIGFVLIWFAATVLRGRRRNFAFGALLAGFATVFVLHVVNPDALIARTNVARAIAASTTAAPGDRLDVMYASLLSADAVPVLLSALPALPEQTRCPLARHMLHRWAPEDGPDFRNWNWSRARAHAAVRAHEPRLRSLLHPGTGDCGPGRPPA